MKKPNLLKSTIGDVLDWAIANKDEQKPAKLKDFVEEVLSKQGFLENLRCFPWSSLPWADKAWNDIQAGVTDKLELWSPSKPRSQAG